jgi:hypothetical protein
MAIPVVNSIINTATKNSAISNAETVELAIKNCQADIAARNNEVYNPAKSYTDVTGASKPCHDAASNATGGRDSISVEEVVGINAINDALKSVNYNQGVFEPFWHKDLDTCVFICTTAAPSGSPTTGDALTAEGIDAGYQTKPNNTGKLVQISTGDVPSNTVMIDQL